MKRLLLLVTVALIGLIAGAVVTGRPQTVVRDIRAVDIRPTTSTTAAPTTAPPATSTTTSTSTTTTEPPASTETPATTEPATTAPATTAPATTAAPSTTRAEAAIASTAPRTAPTPAPTTTTTLVPLQSLYIMVGNASNTFGLATQTATALRELGYELVYRADGIREMAESAVYYSDGLENEARRLADSVGLDSSRVEPRPSEPLTNGTQEFQILLFLGNDWYTVSELGAMVDVEPPGSAERLLQPSSNR